MLPQIDRLPGAEQQSARFKRKAQLAGGQRRTDVGWHVIGPFIGVHVGEQVTLAADRTDALLRHQGPEIGGKIAQYARIGVFVDDQTA